MGERYRALPQTSARGVAHALSKSSPIKIQVKKSCTLQTSKRSILSNLYSSISPGESRNNGTVGGIFTETVSGSIWENILSTSFQDHGWRVFFESHSAASGTELNVDKYIRHPFRCHSPLNRAPARPVKVPAFRPLKLGWRFKLVRAMMLFGAVAPQLRHSSMRPTDSPMPASSPPDPRGSPHGYRCGAPH